MPQVFGEDGQVPAVDKRRARVADLIGDRPLSARSVLATALLGADQPHLTVGELVAIASLFGISDGAARTCLWRMVANGELTSEDGTYALAGGLLERRQRVDDASKVEDAAMPWDGTWELAVVSLERRSAADRLALRKAATALHLAELREGVWIRPDNLDRHRLPTLRAVLDRPGMLQSELSEELSIARPTTTRALDGLEEKGYVERRRPEHDGREIAIFPTAAAIRLKTSLNEASGAVTAKLRKTLGSAEFIDTVSRIRSARSALR